MVVRNKTILKTPSLYSSLLPGLNFIYSWPLPPPPRCCRGMGFITHYLCRVGHLTVSSCTGGPSTPAWAPPCSNMGSLWGHKSWQQICSSIGFSLHGSIDPTQLQCKFPLGSEPPLGILLLCCISPWVSGAQLPHNSLCGLQGNLSSWTSFSPSFFTDLEAVPLPYPQSPLLLQFILHSFVLPS